MDRSDQADLHLNDLNKKVSMMLKKYFLLLIKIEFVVDVRKRAYQKKITKNRQTRTLQSMLSCFDEIFKTCKTETGIEINLGKSVSSVLLSRTAANIAIERRCSGSSVYIRGCQLEDNISEPP